MSARDEHVANERRSPLQEMQAAQIERAAKDAHGPADFAAIEEEWRTKPTDLGGWANRAAQMLQLAKRLAKEAEPHV